MISVIIPVYNAAPYLKRCLDSVCRQAYKDLEIVLVDDGSTDDSGRICDDYVANDARMKVVHQKNQGASYARRNGIAVATGEWLSFVDSDDVVEEDYISRLYDAATGLGVKMAACDQLMREEGADVLVDKSGKTMLLAERDLHRRFFSYQFWGFGGKIYHRSVFDESVFFPKHTLNEDYVVMAQLFYRYKTMAYVPMGLYHYMTHSESLSHQPLSRRMFDEYYNKLWVVDFYRENNPYYTKHAEAQLTETCIKLTVPDVAEFHIEQEKMRRFLRSNMFSILCNPHLRLPLKLMAVVRSW